MKIARAALASAFATSLVLGAVPASTQAAASTFQTTMNIQNLSSSSANVQISFYANGNGTSSASVSYTIAANAKQTINTLPDALTAGFSGSAVVSSDQKVAATVNVVGDSNFAYGDAYVGFNGGSTTVALPLLFKTYYNYNTFFNVQNTSSTAANVTVTYSGGGLSSSVTETASIPAGSSARFDQKTNTKLPDKFNGSAVVTSDQPVAAAVVQNGPDTILAYGGFLNTQVAKFPVAPIVQENNYGYWTSLNVQNTSDTATTVTVTYTPSQGGTACTETQTIQPKTTNYFGNYSLASDGGTVPTNVGFSTTCTRGESKWVGGAVVTTNSANADLSIIVNQLNGKAAKGGSYSAFNPDLATSTVVFPIIQDRYYKYFTGISVYNAGSTSTNITCTYENSSYKDTATLAPGAVFTAQQEGKIASSYNGSGTCTADNSGKIVGVLNQVSTAAATDAFFVSEAINN